MTSVSIRIDPGGIEFSDSEMAYISRFFRFTIPRSCFKNEGNNVFFITLNANSRNSRPSLDYRIPLSQCRQYKIIFTVQSSRPKWQSTPYVWEKFITSNSEGKIIYFYLETWLLKCLLMVENLFSFFILCCTAI